MLLCNTRDLSRTKSELRPYEHRHVAVAGKLDSLNHFGCSGKVVASICINGHRTGESDHVVEAFIERNHLIGMPSIAEICKAIHIDDDARQVLSVLPPDVAQLAVDAVHDNGIQRVLRLQTLSKHLRTVYSTFVLSLQVYRPPTGPVELEIDAIFCHRAQWASLG